MRSARGLLMKLTRRLYLALQRTSAAFLQDQLIHRPLHPRGWSRRQAKQARTHTMDAQACLEARAIL